MKQWLLALWLGYYPLVLQAAIHVTDDLGHTITLSQPARRIITLAPHATEMIVAIGAEERLIAVAQFFDYPSHLDKVPRLQAHGRLDRERILSWQPDLVIAWASGNPDSDIAWLKSVGIPVFLSEPKRLNDIADSLEKLGKLTNHLQAGQHARHDFLQRLAQACPHAMQRPWKNAFYEIWPKPLMTIGKFHWLNDVLEHARLHNAFADQNRQILNITHESLLNRPIDVVIQATSQKVHFLESLPHIQSNPELSRPGPRIVEGLSMLCAQLDRHFPP